jgi:hypothetical protein
VNRRLALLLIAGSGLLALLFAWPRVREQVTMADVTMTAISQPRQEVLVSGYIKNRGAPAFSLETLLIEEPGKEPYHRKVSLDADSAFVLTLGEPKTGTYRVSVQIRNQQSGRSAPQRWAKSPDLVVGGPGSTRPQLVRAKAYDDQRLAVFAGIGAAIAVILLLICFWPQRTQMTQPGGNKA